MVIVIRHDIYGYEGYKKFNNREEAEKYLKSKEVIADKKDGFWYEIKEL